MRGSAHTSVGFTARWMGLNPLQSSSPPACGITWLPSPAAPAVPAEAATATAAAITTVLAARPNRARNVCGRATVPPFPSSPCRGRPYVRIAIRCKGVRRTAIARTLEAVDWINERTVHDWLHDAVHALHIAVGWFHDFLVAWGIFIFLGLLCWLTWKFISMMPNVRPKQLDARADSNVRWDEVAGVEEVRAELEEVVEFLKAPARFAKLGARVPKGVLLYGPPGTGKTLLAKAVANESEANFYFQSASSFVEMWSGLGAARIRRLFQTARKNQPAIIFIDELDAVGRHRGSGGPGGGSQEHDQTLNQLLVEMDGFDESDRLVVIGASNQLGALDTALLRPGRFDRHIGVSAPDLQGREQILEVHTRGKPLADGVRLGEVARQTSGLTGADLANICNEAAISAGRADGDTIVQADFDYALERVVAGLQQRKLITDKEKRVIAYHEAGHALVARLMGDAMQLHKVTIVPRGQALGYTMNLPEEDRYLQSTEELRDWLKVILAGPGGGAGRLRPDHERRRQRPRARDRDRPVDGVRMGDGRVDAAPAGAGRQLRAVRGDQAHARRRAARDHRRGLPRRAAAGRASTASTSTASRRRCSRPRRSSAPRSTMLLEGLEPASNSSLDIGVEAALAMAPPAPPVVDRLGGRAAVGRARPPGPSATSSAELSTVSDDGAASSGPLLFRSAISCSLAAIWARMSAIFAAAPASSPDRSASAFA